MFPEIELLCCEDYPWCGAHHEVDTHITCQEREEEEDKIVG